MKSITRSTILISIILLIFACKKDEIQSPTTTSKVDEILSLWTPSEDPIMGNLKVLIVDNERKPLQDVTVKLGNESLTTNSLGRVTFPDVNMNSKGTFIQAEKEGYINSGRRFFPRAEVENKIQIELIPKIFNHSFSSNEGIIIDSANDEAELNIPADAIIHEEDGSPYSGIVQVAFVYLSPYQSSTIFRMPGNLQGINTSGTERSLKTVGMIAVVLEGANGEKLNLAADKTATLAFPVSAEENDLPSEIPLWSFAEHAGMWVEEGFATLENGMYRGEVSHFSFWNCDIQVNTAELCVLIENEGAPVNGVRIVLSSNNFATCSGMTDNEGYACGLVPANEALDLYILRSCYDTIYSQSLGSYTTGSENTVEISISDAEYNSQITYFNGTVVDCLGEPVYNGLVKIHALGSGRHDLNVYTDQNGYFTSLVNDCTLSDNIYVQPFDLDNMKKGSYIQLEPSTTNDLGEISACGNSISGNIITTTIEGETKKYYIDTVWIEAGQTSFYMIDVNSRLAQHFGFYGNTLGGYNGDSNFIYRIKDTPLEWRFYGGDPTQSVSIQDFTVTEYNDEIISGFFSGELFDFGTEEFRFIESEFTWNIE